MKKTYQDWCIDTLFYIYQNLHDYDFSQKDKGYRYAVNALLTNHASMYYCPNSEKGKGYINLWWDHLNKTSVDYFFKPLLMSASAANCIKEISNSGGSSKFNRDDYKSVLHFEHITPNGVTIDEIERVAKQTIVEKAEISKLLKYHKLVLLTKEERDKFLDGAKDANGHNTTFTKEDLDLLTRWDSTIPPMAKQGYKCKSLGNGPLRLAHLVNCGVSFVLHGQSVDTDSFSGFDTYFCEPYRIVEKN